jgi:[ribosomal protein S5]-alanine N-acetyltransferase
MYYSCPEFDIRPFRKDDEASIALNANHPEIFRFVLDIFPSPYTFDDAVFWVDLNLQKVVHENFAIVINEDVVGCVGIIPGTDVHKRSVAIGYWLAPDFWGRGIATRACNWLVKYTFDNFDVNRIWAGVFSNNPASAKVLLKCGFKHEATLQKAVWKENQVLDELIFAILKD